MTAANAAEEAAKQSKDLNIPYWRTLKANGSLNEKYPGGPETQKEKLENEGFIVTRKRKIYVVQNYQDFLVN
jgi:alkylated DNA nucleotide flippase Atl1